MNKQLLSMMSLGVVSVAIAGFGLPAEGGLFDFFGHRSRHSDCGYVACAPACATVCAPVCDYDDDDHAWCQPACGYPVCGYTVCAPAPVYNACACPPPVSVCGYDVCDCDDDDDDCDDDD